MQDITAKQKKRIERLAELAGKDNAGILLHIFEMTDKFDDSQEETKGLLDKIEKLFADVEAIKPKKGTDYMTDDEKEEMMDEVYSRIPKPEKLDKKELLNAFLDAVKKKIRQPKDGKDAVIDYDRILNDVLKNIRVPQDGKPGKSGSPDSPNQIVSKINRAENKINKDQIEGLDDIERIARENIRPAGGTSDGLPITTTHIYKNGAFVGRAKNIDFRDDITEIVIVGDVVYVPNKSSGGSGGALTQETPAGTIDGSNVDFTLTKSPTVLMLFRNGQLQAPGGEDYTLTAANITFVEAPLNGDILLAYYQS